MELANQGYGMGYAEVHYCVVMGTRAGGRRVPGAKYDTQQEAEIKAERMSKLPVGPEGLMRQYTVIMEMCTIMYLSEFHGSQGAWPE